MTITVGTICEREVVCAGRETTVQAAAGLLRHFHAGSVVVVTESAGGGRLPVGIVTDRDLVVEVAALDLDPRVITIGDISTPALVTVGEDAGLLAAVELMRSKGVRRLPVTDGAGELVGIVSAADLFEALAGELAETARALVRERQREARARR